MISYNHLFLLVDKLRNREIKIQFQLSQVGKIRPMWNEMKKLHYANELTISHK